MKTRTEMIYDFMVSLSANPQFFDDSISDEMSVEAVYSMAARLADKILRTL